MFAVSSVEAAKRYYETLQNLQAEQEHPLKLQQSFRLPPMKNKMQLAIFQMRPLNPLL